MRNARFERARRMVVLAGIMAAVGMSGALSLTQAEVAPARVATSAVDVLPEYHNLEVTALVEDAETVRLGAGVGWDAALACRSYSGYLGPWTDAKVQEDVEKLVKRGVRLYELVKCVDDGIESVRLARDSRDEPRLMEDVGFWKNELALASREVVAYATEAEAMKGKLEAQLRAAGEQRGLKAVETAGIPWANAEREAWRKAGPGIGIRLALDPHAESQVKIWNDRLSLAPGYMVAKMHSAGVEFFSPERPIGAWGYNCTAKGQYDWAMFNGIVKMVSERGGKLLLELPTLAGRRTEAQLGAERQELLKQKQWIWNLYAPSLPAYLEEDAAASLTGRDKTGKTFLFGGVQLMNPAVAGEYGEYLKAMAANLKQEGLYAAIAAIHLEQGDSAKLAEQVDYSDLSKARWQKFLTERFGTIEKLNAAAGTAHQSFAAVELPDAKLTLAEGKGAVPPLQVEYMHFRRAWVAEYLAIKAKLIAAAFPDKLIIREMRQFGDHDGISNNGEAKWGGFQGETDDLAQWTATGPRNEEQPFMIRSVGPVGFGTRPSDSIESMYRDYLWINFRDPANLTRYFYDWVAHGYMDYQMGWHSVGNHWLSNQLVYHVGPTVANTAPVPQRIGLMLPRATFDLADGPIYHEYLGWDWMLGSAKFSYTRVDERFIRSGGLKNSKLEVLVLPGARAMDATVAREISDWVSAGGTLVASTVPGKTDEYGKVLATPALEEVLGTGVDGTTSEAVAGTPLGISIPRGIFSGNDAQSTDRKPAFEVLKPGKAAVVAKYASGKPAITRNEFGKGVAVTLGYPFGKEAVEAERTSITFYRTYSGFVREAQLVSRTAWLLDFVTKELKYKPEYAVESASVERFKGKEANALGLSLPKGLSQTSGDWFYVRTVGDLRAEHEIDLEQETLDLALRFFPRQRAGLTTTFLGISTREVHYISPRGAVNMFLAKHTYQCRINNPKIQALWDVARNVPVGFEKDATGVRFNVSLPSGHIMMLAVSEKPTVVVFAAATFPGRTKAQVIAACKALGEGKTPAAVVNLTPGEIGPWLKELGATKKKLVISYGQEANKAAAEKLAASMKDRWGVEASISEQTTTADAKNKNEKTEHSGDASIFIGDDWTNNDMAMQGSFWNWGNHYGAHLPFTATYAWPGKGRAVVSLSRRYGLMTKDGWRVGQGRVGAEYQVLKYKDATGRKLFIAGNGEDAVKAVTAVIEEFGKAEK